MQNQWNLLHAIVPFSVLLYALSVIGKMPQPTKGPSTYEPMVFIVFSLIVIAFSLIGFFCSPKGLKSFITLLIVHPFWIFSAVTPHFLANALEASIASFIIMLVSCVFQILVGLYLNEIRNGNNVKT